MKIFSKVFAFWYFISIGMFYIQSSSYVFADDIETSRYSNNRKSSNSSRNSRKRRRNSNQNDSIEQIKEDCSSKYILALDRECYNSEKVHLGGVYSDCSDKTVADYYDLMDMQLSYVVGVSKFASYKQKCDSYKGYALNKWLASKGIIEKSAVKGSSLCVLATDKLAAAKQCYSVALSHDGNFIEFRNLMTRTCGKFPDVAERFAKAGDIGWSNVPKLLENYSSLQFTNKSENWRNAVEAVFMGYIYDARQKCGEENYKVITGNKYSVDKRDNLITEVNKSFVKSVVNNVEKRRARLITASPSVIETENSNGLLYNKSYGYGISSGLVGSNKSVLDSGNTYSDKDQNMSSNFKNVYVIDKLNDINLVRSRLLNIISILSVPSVSEQDDIDKAIVLGLGGRIGVDDMFVNDVISSIKEKDVFILKSNDSLCNVMFVKRKGELVNIPYNQLQIIESLRPYLSGCSRFLN